jgi:hypothetical protein
MQSNINRLSFETFFLLQFTGNSSFDQFFSSRSPIHQKDSIYTETQPTNQNAILCCHNNRVLK